MNDRQLLEQHSIAPKKSLGQNFLHDPHTLDKIVASADLTPDTTVLEIGPGTGNLTAVLADHAARVIAVELDDRLVPILRQRFAQQAPVEIVHGDILEIDLGDRLGTMAQPKPYTVVANVPYYITSAIMRHVFEKLPRPQRMVLTMQREVAERLIAEPGDMSLLAVSVQFYGQPQIVMRLSPAVFWPRPDVDSAVVRIDVYDTPPVDVPNEALFFRVVRAGFSQKRKQLRNAISNGLHVAKTQAGDLLTQAGIDPQRRAETLTLAEWAALARVVNDSPT
ncbi:MAG: 16S rRNA (adenine(1518)-N(6)/adenine(1519)-N(6))-dimethyltransferase RsmA [Anaerolineae bacterium]|nr:16S rRNA (adenine(1518)-N(6)/adenine(1519)-N(6))-dimethyltransferase RsmA [Anaerolineae bacterium]